MAQPPKVEPPTDRTTGYDDTVQRDVDTAGGRKHPSVTKTLPPADRIIGTEGLPEVDPGNYDLGAEFARGGLGRILKARDQRLRRIVAIKELLSKDSKAETRFVREAFITARLEHPNIVPVHEAGVWPSGKRFYAMKLVEGRTLAEALDAATSREERLALLPHVIDVADAVAYAHSQGILHRDLKPGNVMVGAFGETVVIDWGLAKDIWLRESELRSDAPISPDALMTSDGIVVGTPPYMPPEQASAREVDERSDVYSLGAMLYHVLCGRRPYQDVKNKDVLMAVVSGPPKELADLAPDCPRDLVAIATKAMARDPDDRYPTAREMAEELRRFTTGQLVGAHEYSSGELAMRFVRRNATSVTVSLLALFLLAGFAAWSFENIRDARDRAEQKAYEATETSDALRLQKARSLLDKDPTETLAWLKTLNRVSRPGAASIAAEASHLGVSRFVDRGGQASLDALAMAPSGTWAASGGRTGGIRLISLRNGDVEVLSGHTDRVTQLRFSANEDYLISSSYDDTLRIWPLGDETRGTSSVLEGHEGDVKGFALLPQDDLLSVSSDGTLRRWTRRGELQSVASFDLANRALKVQARADVVVTGGHGDAVLLWRGNQSRRLVCDGREVQSFAVSGDGSMIACGGASGLVRLYTLPGLSHRDLVSEGAETLDLAFGDGRLVSTHFDGSVLEHDLQNGEVRMLEQHEERVGVGVFGGDDRQRLATAGWDHEIWLRNLEDGDLRILRGHTDTISSLRFDRTGSWLASSSWDGTTRLWALEDDSTVRLRGHEVGVHGVDISPDGKSVASGGHDDLVRLWDLSADAVRVLRGHTDHVFRVLFSPDGRWVASSSDDRTVRLWDVNGNDHRVLKGHTADVEELAFSEHGRWLASAGEDDRVWLWSVPSGEGRPLVGHQDFVTDVGFHPDGKRLFSTGRDGAVFEWSTSDPNHHRILLQMTGPVWSLAIDPDGSELAVAGDDALRILDIPSGRLMAAIDLPGAQLVEWSRDRTSIAVANASSELWLCTRSIERCEPLEPHRGPVLALSFDRSGRVLASASADSTVRLWDTRTLEYRVLSGHGLQVFDVAFGPRSDRLVSGSADTDVRVWPVRLPPDPEELRGWLESKTRLTVED
ncbi:MAG: serine/threonine-protein kinase [Myxococcota bacterium]